MALLTRTQHPDTLGSKERAQLPSGTDLVDSEHVEVGDVVFLSVFDPRPALLLVYQLADVLVHKLALYEKRQIRLKTWQVSNLDTSQIASFLCINLMKYGVPTIFLYH